MNLFCLNRSIGDKIIQQLVHDLRRKIAIAFRVSDALAMLDMVVVRSIET